MFKLNNLLDILYFSDYLHNILWSL